MVVHHGRREVNDRINDLGQPQRRFVANTHCPRQVLLALPCITSNSVRSALEIKAQTAVDDVATSSDSKCDLVVFVVLTVDVQWSSLGKSRIRNGCLERV